MNRPKNNNDLTINSDSACIQGIQAILKRLQGHYKCSDIKSNTKWRRVLQCIVFSSTGVKTYF